MKYSKVYIDSIGYEIAPIVVSSAELEGRLEDLYRALHLAEGQLEALTGIVERRWWEEGYRLSDGAFAAARRALRASQVSADQIEVLIYGGVCREHFEPATACRVGALLGVGPETVIHDVGNACRRHGGQGHVDIVRQRFDGGHRGPPGDLGRFGMDGDHPAGELVVREIVECHVAQCLAPGGSADDRDGARPDQRIHEIVHGAI